MKEVFRKNNFDVLRLLFATFVVISHSYWINGRYPEEILNFATNKQIDLGALGVKGFFVISGYLVFKSMERSYSFIHYLWKRLLRLFPALFVLCIVIMLTIPFVYQSNIPLLQNKDYWLFTPKVLCLFHDEIFINGVFSNHYKKDIDASLWTLSYEFTCYLLVGLLFFIKNKNWRFYIMLMIFGITWYLTSFRYLWLNERLFKYLNLKSFYFYDLLCFFSAGALFSHLNLSKVKYRFFIVGIGLLLCVFSIKVHNFYFFKYILLPVVVLLLATYKGGWFNNLSSRIGDISYGVYIYGWFVQQCLYHFFKLDVWELTFASLLIIYLLGWLSWTFIEKKSLKFKDIVK